MVDRRAFLTAAGLVSVGSMAGCLGDEDEDIPDVETTDGPAEFAVYGASVSDDESIPVDSDTTSISSLVIEVASPENRTSKRYSIASKVNRHHGDLHPFPLLKRKSRAVTR